MVYYFSVTEITKVRASLFEVNGVKKEPLVLPEPDGTPVTITEKVFVPVKDHPEVRLLRARRGIRPIVYLNIALYYTVARAKEMRRMT